MTQAPLPAAARSAPRPHRLARALCAAAFSWCCLGAQAAPLDDLRRQIEASQFEQAYATAQAHPQFIGDPHFDFLFGVAAIGVGRIPEGLMALERHLAVVPANDRARLELARGYFLLGEFTRARAEFEFVLRYNPTANVRSTITSYLQAMQTRDATDSRALARFYVEAGLGHDTNVNGGTHHDLVALPFAPLELGGTDSKAIADTVVMFAVGGQHLVRVTNRFSAFVGADLDHRENAETRRFNLSNGGVYAGFSQLSGKALWRATLNLSELMVGGSRYRDTLALGLEANATPSPEFGLTGFVQFAEQRHAATEDIRDARFTSVGAMAVRNLPDVAGTPQLGIRLSWTQEQNMRKRADLSRDTALVRLFASVSPIDRLRVSAGLTIYQQHFGAEDLVFQTDRRDTFIGGDLLVNYALDANWAVRADAVWTTNRSNQDLYDSGRKALSVKLRYQF